MITPSRSRRTPARGDVSGDQAVSSNATDTAAPLKTIVSPHLVHARGDLQHRAYMSTKEVAVILRPHPDCESCSADVRGPACRSLARYRHGTGISGRELISADVTTDATCSCCAMVIS